MSRSLALFFVRHRFALVFGLFLTVCFFVYSHFNQRYVGATDWYGYYQEGLLLKEGRVTLPTELPIPEFSAVVPLGFTATAAGTAVPQYPPGFPALIALAATVNLQFYLMPLVGVASCLVLFQLIRDLTQSRLTAGLYTLLWAFFPIVVFGSTTLMSDLVAALFIFWSYSLYRRQLIFWSASALAFALCVRPTNVLYAVVFGLLLLRDRNVLRYLAAMVPLGIVYGIYNYFLFGAPWRTGYFDIRGDLVARVFIPHLKFYLWQIFLQCGPVVVFFALYSFRKPTREKLFYAVWFSAFLFFYCFWLSGGDRWWWTRFLLPGLAPIFLLSAQGFADAWNVIKTGGLAPAGKIGLQFLLAAVICLTPIYYIKFGLEQQDLWFTDKGHEYYEVAKKTEAIVPAGSYIGSVEFAGSFRLYTQLGSFVSVNSNSLELVPHVLNQKKEVYLLVEPWNEPNGIVKELMQRYSAQKMLDFDIWGGIALYRLRDPHIP